MLTARVAASAVVLVVALGPMLPAAAAAPRQRPPVVTGRPDQLPPGTQATRAGTQEPRRPTTGTPPRDRSGRTQPPPAEGTASLVGRVLDAESGQPLRRASVRAFNTVSRSPRDRRTYVTRSDDMGSYTLEKLPGGTYTVAAQRTGYVSDGAGGGAQRLSLENGQRIAGIDFRLHRGGVITGRITDDAGDPAQGVSIRVLRTQRVRGRERFVPATGRWSLSDDLGNFRLFGLPAGEYIVAAEPEARRMNGMNTVNQGTDVDLVTTYGPGTPSPADAMRITVVPGQTSSMDIQLVASRVVSISGRVVDSSGAPLEAGRINIRSEGAEVVGQGMRGSGIFNDGSFHLDGITPGTYILMAQGRPFGPMANSDRAARLESARVPITVGTEDIENLVITTSPPSTASGRLIVEGDASKLEGVLIRILSRSLLLESGTTIGGGQTRVGDDHTFTVGGLTGETALLVVGLPRGWWVKAVRVNGKDATDSFDFGSGRRWTGVEIVLNDRPAAIGGTLIDAGGQPASGASVMVFPVDFAERATPVGPGIGGMGMPDQNGTFTIEGVRPGEYFVVAVPSSDMQRNLTEDHDRLRELSERAERVTVREGDMQFVTLRVEF